MYPRYFTSVASTLGSLDYRLDSVTADPSHSQNAIVRSSLNSTIAQVIVDHQSLTY